MSDPCVDFKPVVLIAQHSEKDLKILEEASKKCGKYDVVTACTGQEIIDKVNAMCFDAAIIGLRFPDLTGSTLAYLIHEFDPMIKIGFLTIYNTKTLVEAVNELGCVFLDKTQEMKNLDKLCNKIYNIATEIPCTDKLRETERNSSILHRNKYRKYSKLIMPTYK